MRDALLTHTQLLRDGVRRREGSRNYSLGCHDKNVSLSSPWSINRDRLLGFASLAPSPRMRRDAGTLDSLQGTLHSPACTWVGLSRVARPPLLRFVRHLLVCGRRRLSCFGMQGPWFQWPLHSASVSLARARAAVRGRSASRCRWACSPVPRSP